MTDMACKSRDTARQTIDRWPNQEEAFQFAMARPSVMLDMDMGTGKTRVAIDVIRGREDVKRVLVVCPKAVVSVWSKEVDKHAPDMECFVWCCNTNDSVKTKADKLWSALKYCAKPKQIIVMNYDSVWRAPMGDLVRKLGFDMVVCDESHRIKAAGSKISKYMAMIGRSVKYKMCLSGTPMANSPLDVYGQYRFLDPSIFGVNHGKFLAEYAIMSYTSPPFVVGCKNQKSLSNKFNSIAYSCKMSDIRDRIKLPEVLPPNKVSLRLPTRDMDTSKTLGKEFVAECADGQFVVLSNVLNKMLRLQQITSGYCVTQDSPLSPAVTTELNTVKRDALTELLLEFPQDEKIVVFCVFTHDIQAVMGACWDAVTKFNERMHRREFFELSGNGNQLEEWKSSTGGVLAVQIQAGAEGVDMTCSHLCVYYSLPYSLALYNQSLARLQRPGQDSRVLFSYLICEKTIDEVMYKSLINKKDLIESVKSGEFDYGYFK